MTLARGKSEQTWTNTKGELSQPGLTTALVIMMPLQCHIRAVAFGLGCLIHNNICRVSGPRNLCQRKQPNGISWENWMIKKQPSGG